MKTLKFDGRVGEVCKGACRFPMGFSHAIQQQSIMLMFSCFFFLLETILEKSRSTFELLNPSLVVVNNKMDVWAMSISDSSEAYFGTSGGGVDQIRPIWTAARAPNTESLVRREENNKLLVCSDSISRHHVSGCESFFYMQKPWHLETPPKREKC